MKNQKITQMSFAKVYPLYIAKAERKNRTKEEVDQIITWLTGYDQETLQQMNEELSFETFFSQAPQLNPARKHITGGIFGIRIEEIEEPMVQEIRYLDKLIDELAKGKAMTKILRSVE